LENRFEMKNAQLFILPPLSFMFQDKNKTLFVLQIDFNCRVILSNDNKIKETLIG